MISVTDAIRIVEEKEPELEVYAGIETQNWFQFLMVSKDTGEGLGNSMTYAVNKVTKEAGWKPTRIEEDEDYTYGRIHYYDNGEIEQLRA